MGFQEIAKQYVVIKTVTSVLTEDQWCGLGLRSHSPTSTCSWRRAWVRRDRQIRVATYCCAPRAAAKLVIVDPGRPDIGSHGSAEGCRGASRECASTPSAGLHTQVRRHVGGTPCSRTRPSSCCRRAP